MLEFLNKYDKLVVGVVTPLVECKFCSEGFKLDGIDLILGDEDSGVRLHDVKRYNINIKDDEMILSSEGTNVIVIGV